MSVRTVPLIDARHRQSKLSLWLWRVGLAGLALTFVGTSMILASWAFIEIAGIIVHSARGTR